VSYQERIRNRQDVADLHARYARDRRPEDRDTLLERYAPLARRLALRYHTGNEREDVLQTAYIGLLNAIERYDPGRGLAFTSFAVPTILGEIRRYFRDHGWSVRAPREVQELAGRAERATDALTGELGRVPTVSEVAARCEATEEQVLEARASATAHYAVSLDQPAHEPEGGAIGDWLPAEEPGFARVEDEIALHQRLEDLPPLERTALLLRFRDELMQREIGSRLGLSQMQVSRLLAKSLATLAAPPPP
jgi:RNA polymerase sigma-B factor